MGMPDTMRPLGPRSAACLRSATAVVIALLAACGGRTGTPAPPAPAAAPYPAGLSTQSMTVGGMVRRYRVHVPSSLAGAPSAVVLVLHGGGGTGLRVADSGRHPLSVFRSVADREGFIVVFPAGLPAGDRRAGWTDCRADDAVSIGADDVGFLAALVSRLQGEYRLTRAQTFMAGGSNGAMMTHAFAMAHPELLGAAATSGGNLALTPRPGACAAGPTAPLPMLIAHGTADGQMPWGGGCVANVGGRCRRGRVVSAEATRDRWLRANGLEGVTPTQQVLNPDPTDGGPANRFDYAGATPVQWWRLDGAGHTVASRAVPIAPDATTGTQNRDVEFAEIAWAFFKGRLP